MKNGSFIKFFSTCCAVFLLFTAAIAQDDFVETPYKPGVSAPSIHVEAASIQKNFAAQGFKVASINKEGSANFSGKDALGDFKVSFFTQKMTKGDETADVTTITMTQGGKTETLVLGQTGEKVFRVSSGGVSSFNLGKFNACIGRIASNAACTSCVSCAKNCASSHASWYGKALCAIRCIGPCIRCGGLSVLGIVRCAYSAL
jgi:hypothetical protein